MEEGPNRPKPQQLKLDSKTTAVLVLDLSTRCEDPKEVCFQLMGPLAEFLDRTRQSSVPILYTISAAGEGDSFRRSCRTAQAAHNGTGFIPRCLRQVHGRRAAG